jgi:hypothetical protein
LYKYGFLPNYYIWTEHGEEDQDVDLGGHFSGGEDVGVEDQFEAMNEMINDAFRPFSNVLNVNANMENETTEKTFRGPKSSHCNQERALCSPESTTSSSCNTSSRTTFSGCNIGSGTTFSGCSTD